MSVDKQHINLHLDAHTVSLDVPAESEPFYRKAALLLNERYQHFLKIRPNASAEQLWMYTALEMGVRLKALEEKKNLEPVQQELQALNDLIKKTIQQ